MVYLNNPCPVDRNEGRLGKGAGRFSQAQHSFLIVDILPEEHHTLKIKALSISLMQ